MFDRLRKAFSATSPEGRPVTSQEVARWAAEKHLMCVPQPQSPHFDLGGQVKGYHWRFESGPSARDYIQGFELRGRADIGADSDPAVMVLTRSLHEALERRAYHAITDTLHTTVNANLPEEMRWLAMFDKVAWPELPTSFRQNFAVVAERVEHAERWLNAAVVSQLLNTVEGEGTVQGPMLLMLARGKVYLRMQRERCDLQEIALAVDLLSTAAEMALLQLPSPGGPAPAPAGDA